MIHLITVTGQSARNFHLSQQYMADFKSLMRTVTSGRVMLVSTRFRSDLFYYDKRARNKAILKLWALYANTTPDDLDKKDLNTTAGDQKSLSKYFLAMNKMSTNWHHYGLYKKALYVTYNNDQQNPLTNTLLQCDRYLTEHPSIKRAPLISPEEKLDPPHSKDTFSLAMRIINNETHSN